MPGAQEHHQDLSEQAENNSKSHLNFKPKTYLKRRQVVK